MSWLNYHHLLYFWMVAKEGGIAPASKKLHLAVPTISGQIKELERALGEKLFLRQGRGLVLTEVGKTAFKYAEDIFSLGRELVDTIKGRSSGGAQHLAVGISDAVPKMVACRLLMPAHRAVPDLRLSAIEDRHERLLSSLSMHELDVVISDGPVGPGARVKAFSHLLGECGVTWFAVGKKLTALKDGFPRTLNGAPILLPSTESALRRSIDSWFERENIRPRVVAEFDDSALLKVYGEGGFGAFPAPSVIEKTISVQFGAEIIGRTPEVVERFYAISGERRIKHPAVVAICDSARTDLFG